MPHLFLFIINFSPDSVRDYAQGLVVSTIIIIREKFCNLLLNVVVREFVVEMISELLLLLNPGKTV